MTAASVTQALVDYESALRSIGAPVVESLNPGATRADLDRAQAQAGFLFPEDARAVWAWHNGSARAISPIPEVSLPPGRWFPDVITAVELGSEHTKNWVDALGDESGYVDARLLAFCVPVGVAGLMVIDCADADAPDAPAITLGRDDLFPDADHRFTVTDTVRLWTGWILDGLYDINDRGVWSIDLARTPRGDERHQL